MLWIVWIVVVVLALVVLGAVAYTVFGAFSRLGREVSSFERDVRPLRAQAQDVSAQAAAARERRANED